MQCEHSKWWDINSGFIIPYSLIIKGTELEEKDRVLFLSQY